MPHDTVTPGIKDYDRIISLLANLVSTSQSKPCLLTDTLDFLETRHYPISDIVFSCSLFKHCRPRARQGFPALLGKSYWFVAPDLSVDIML